MATTVVEDPPRTKHLPFSLAKVFRIVFKLVNDTATANALIHANQADLHRQMSQFKIPSGVDRKDLDAIAHLFILEYCFCQAIPIDRPLLLHESLSHEWLIRARAQISFLRDERRTVALELAEHDSVAARLLLGAVMPVELDILELKATHLTVRVATQVTDIITMKYGSGTRFYLQRDCDDSTPESILEQHKRLFQLMNASVEGFAVADAMTAQANVTRNLVIASGNMGVFVDLCLRGLKSATQNSPVCLIVVAPLFSVKVTVLACLALNAP